MMYFQRSFFLDLRKKRIGLDNDPAAKYSWDQREGLQVEIASYRKNHACGKEVPGQMHVSC